MDRIYRRQRHIYDLTRKYYLFGRDTMLDSLGLPGTGAGSAVLEIGCGTGRNLARLRRRWPGAALFGLDISAEMLASARDRLGPGAVLARGDAAGFDAQGLFGRSRFDRIVMPYCLSMIPPWRAALDHASGLLARNGSLHIVDFGDLAGLPGPLAVGLRRWLGRFHVSPRSDLIAEAMALAARRGLACAGTMHWGGYWQAVTLTRPI
ncbi:class I SAM-dependent methyltransferase [Novosphingobium piscinae]|uniref:Class I SAM-dependent methyltransferase n=2 Tax=Novosphingobium piscinae TaxID=1507448 RepID=A0A7X1KNK0_9SPHN|nr:class I SAM-dependent methyltransferase [Novosphingobium piscinae]